MAFRVRDVTSGWIRRLLAGPARRRRTPQDDEARRVFSADARRVADSGTREEVEALMRRLEGSGWNTDDLDLELELLNARLAVLEVIQSTRSGSLPVVVTQHKAISAETCHFLAPASVATDAGETSAKLFLTAQRLRVVGGGNIAAGWGTIRDVGTRGRDLIVTTGPGQYTVRCNSVADAWVAAELSRVLIGRHRRPPDAAEAGIRSVRSND